MGSASFFRNGLGTLAGILLNRIAVGYGTSALAAINVANRITMFMTSACLGFGQGFQPVCGAAFGAKQTARCQTAYRFCQRVLLVFSLAVGAAVFAFAPALTARFAHDAQTADVAGRALRLQSAVFFAQSAVILMTMLTQSLGQTVRAALVATSRQGLFLLPLLTLLPHVFGLWGLLACQSVSDVISLVFSWLLTRKVFPPSPFTRSSSPRGGDNRPQTAEG